MRTTLKIAIGVAIGLFVFTIIGGGVLWWMKGEADTRAALARADRLKAESLYQNICEQVELAGKIDRDRLSTALAKNAVALPPDVLNPLGGINQAEWKWAKDYQTMNPQAACGESADMDLKDFPSYRAKWASSSYFWLCMDYHDAVTIEHTKFGADRIAFAVALRKEFPSLKCGAPFDNPPWEPTK